MDPVGPEGWLTSVGSDDKRLRDAFARFPSGVAAMCAEIEGTPVGLVVTSFSVGVSFQPALVLFSVQNSSSTWPRLRQAEHIGVSVLGEEHAETCAQLASRTKDRFAGLDTETSPERAVFLHGSSLWLDCVIGSELPAGDHHIVLLEVRALREHANTEPLVYHAAGFRKLVRSA